MKRQVAECRLGLRERKKRRTREALLLAALDLFQAQGYDRTTVDEIVEVVDVSQRTFFRYFASKEEVAFAVQETVEAAFLEELRARPLGEPPFDAMRRAARCMWSRIGETLEALISVDLHMRTYRMIESTPALVAAHMRRGMALERRIAALVAEREGVDVEQDPRPRVAVAAFFGAMRVTGQVWGRGSDTSVESLRELTELHLGQLGPALAGDWRAADHRQARLPAGKAGPPAGVARPSAGVAPERPGVVAAP